MNLLLLAEEAEQSIPTLTTTCMTLSAGFSFLLPVILLVYLWKFKKADLRPFFVGCIVFILFSLCLEGIFAKFIMSTPLEKILGNNIVLYAIYAGILAGLFEEGGRLLAFKTVLKKDYDNDYDSLMYGAGHGGIEAVITLGLVMISNIAIASMVNQGLTNEVTKDLSGDSLKQMNDLIDSLINTNPFVFLTGILERACACAMHMCFSVMVWFSVKKKDKSSLFFMAMILHAVVNAIMLIINDLSGSVLYTEIFILIATIAIYVYTKKIWSTEATTVLPSPSFVTEPVVSKAKKANEMVKKVSNKEKK